MRQNRHDMRFHYQALMVLAKAGENNKIIESQNITMEIRAAAKPDISVPSPALVTVVANIPENALHGALESKAKSPSITVYSVAKHSLTILDTIYEYT